MNEAIKVSVLISTYNHERYIDQCLESVMNQTLREIEIIVVDDCSTDSTLSHIDAAAEKDSRIHVIRHEVNRGACRARKSAVLASRGEYVMLVDGDDWIEPDTCERLSAKMQETGVDILHFGTVVENCANYSPQAISEVEADIAPYLGGMLTESIITEAFLKSRFQNYSVKIFRGKLLRTVYAEIDDGYYIYLEDFYQTFCLLLRSKSYLGIEDRFYHYCYGRGLLGLCRNSLSLQNFQKYCNCADVYRAIQRRSAKWVAEANEEERRLVPPEDLNAILAAVQQKFVKFLLGIFFMRVKPEDQPNAYLMMEQAWQLGGPGFVGLLAQNAWEERTKIAEAISGADWLKFEARPIRTIALYYVKLTNGGTERVIALLCNLFAELRDEEGNPRFQVVLITDGPPSEDDYPLTSLVIRKQVPPDQESNSDYAPRAAAWNRIIDEQKIDMVLYPNWRLESQFMDFLTIKRTERSPALVMHMHTWSPQLYQGNHVAIETKKLARLSDGVVTLSETDRLYWSRSNPRSVYIPNSYYVKASECRRAAYGKHILWLARIASEKQPLEIPRIMREAVVRDPEIVCHVVGAWDANLEKELRESIAAEGLSKHVILEGFHADVTPYYERCSLFLMTSRYEGFALTLFEAAAYGLPTVLYEMPWLAYNDLIDGAITVPQLDAEAAAEAIVRLVNDPEEWQRRSDSIYNSARRYMETDITGYWMSLIDLLEKGTLPKAPRFDSKTEVLLDQLDDFHDDAVSSLIQQRDQERDNAIRLEAERRSWETQREAWKAERASLETAYRSLEADLRSLQTDRGALEADREFWKSELYATRDTVSFRVGCAITWLPRKIRGGVRCYREHGGKYTFYRLLYHLHLAPNNDGSGEM